MFNFFKKQIHEPISKQLADLNNYPAEIAKMISSGIDCDSLHGASGKFGSISNPIPVNGVFGEIKYLGKMRGKSGLALFFHRIGSSSSQVCEHSVEFTKLFVWMAASGQPSTLICIIHGDRIWRRAATHSCHLTGISKWIYHLLTVSTN